MAANFYTASLYKAHRNNKEMADHWMNASNDVIEGIKAQRTVENPVYLADRHMGRGRGGDHDHFFAEWV